MKVINSNNGSVSGAEQGEYTENVTITLSAHTGAGSIFGGWVDNGTGKLLSISESLRALVEELNNFKTNATLEHPVH